MDEDNNNNSNNPSNRNQGPNDHEIYRLRGSSHHSVADHSNHNNNNNNENTNNSIYNKTDDGNEEKDRRRIRQHCRNQDVILQNVTRRQERYQYLIQKNGQVDYPQYLHEWFITKLAMVRDVFLTTDMASDVTRSQQMEGEESERTSTSTSTTTASNPKEPGSFFVDDGAIVHHYPWNTTGFYRGSWKRIVPDDSTTTTTHVNHDDDDSANAITSTMIQRLSTILQNDHLVLERSMENSTSRYHNNTNISFATSRSDAAAIDDDRHRWVNARQIQEEMIQRLRYRNQAAAIVPLPLGLKLLRPELHHPDQNRTNSTVDSMDNWNAMARTIASYALIRNQAIDENVVGASAAPLWSHLPPRQQQQRPPPRRMVGMNEYSNKDIFSQSTRSTSIPPPSDTEPPPTSLTLTRDNGRAAFQLFGQRIVGMKELSYVSGFLKLYDSTSTGYSTRKDVLLRVQGVLIHSIGRLSLVANMNEDAVALVIDPSYNSNNDNNMIEAHRRLQAAMQSLSTVPEQPTMREPSPNADALINIRNEAISLYGNNAIDETNHDATDDEIENAANAKTKSISVESLLDETPNGYSADTWSDFVIPHPFFHDDTSSHSVRSSLVTSSTPRIIPIQEQVLERNAVGCSFEITMDVSDVEYSIGAWKKMLLRRYQEMKMMDPPNQPGSNTVGVNNHQRGISANSNNDYANRHVRPYTSSWPVGHMSREYPKEAMAMNMVGEIHSYDCNFHAQVNTTALRTDWEATTRKAINYSFYMMVVCLVQIFILLRQLLHSQSQSVATRVSLICIGWQTVIDALLCLIHIYLSLAIQPLFTAFASVAFFKLLIFCVIEMKYMAIILQARHNSNGGTTLTADALRQQVALLHIRFYVALVIVFLFVFYSPGRNRTYIILALYSFWVPQIVLNVITEAKTPLHKHYIYGTSVTRLIAPLYIFGVRNNFLKEVYPDSTTDSVMCQLLILWVGCQTAILIAQGKYGARFMIPKRFLPPKFDYSRPIPASMLPPGALLDLPSPEAMEDRINDNLPAKGSTKREDGDSLTPTSHPTSNRELELHSVPIRHQTADTTRSRHHRGGRAASTAPTAPHRRSRNNSSAMVKEAMSMLPKAKPTPAPVLECSICYENIDVRDRFKYMLAPCNHLYHSECLKQWMEVKMECPICRTPLPPL